MPVAAERQSELFADPLEPRVLPHGGWPFWTLNTLNRGRTRGMDQRPYRLSQLEWVLGHVRKDVDTYMSQAFFSRPCRRALHVAWLTHAYVDLDLYKLPLPPNPGDAGILLRLFCNDEGIPEPSLIVFSGRGVYLKWMWSSPLPRAATGRAVAVNKALVRRFTAWGADPAAVDVSRILRVVGTTNSKSGEAARVLWQAERNGQVLTYDFDMFADEILPFTLEQVRGFRDAAETRKAELHVLSQERGRRQAQRERVAAGRKAFSAEDWCWGVVEDLRRLAQIRHGGTVSYVDEQRAGAKAGPDLFGHIGACHLARVIPAAQLWPEMQAWARIILPAEYVRGDYLRHSSTLLSQARAAAAGETVQRRGRASSPVYAYKAPTIIERLEITPGEMREMTRLIDKDEKRRRDREATIAQRRASGVRERGAYEDGAAARREQAKALRQGGKTWAEVAQVMDLASADAARMLASRPSPEKPNRSVPTYTTA